MKCLQNVSDMFIVGQLRWWSARVWYEGCWFNLGILETTCQIILEQDAEILKKCSQSCFLKVLDQYFLNPNSYDIRL